MFCYLECSLYVSLSWIKIPELENPMSLLFLFSIYLLVLVECSFESLSRKISWPFMSVCLGGCASSWAVGLWWPGDGVSAGEGGGGGRPEDSHPGRHSKPGDFPTSLVPGRVGAGETPRLACCPGVLVDWAWGTLNKSGS